MELQRLNKSTPENLQIAELIKCNLNLPVVAENLLAHQNIKAGLEMSIVSNLDGVTVDSVRVANEFGDSLHRITIGYDGGEVFDADFVVVDQ